MNVVSISHLVVRKILTIFDEIILEFLQISIFFWLSKFKRLLLGLNVLLLLMMMMVGECVMVLASEVDMSQTHAVQNA